MKVGIGWGVLLLLAAPSTRAHEAGWPHAEPAAAAVSTRPRLSAGGQLTVPEAVQRLLGIRTAPVEAATADTLELTGEVLAHPDSAGVIRAPLAGRIEPAAGGQPWPLPGQRVHAGQTLAILVPQISEQEQARRRAALALIDQRLNVARINAGRMRTQAEAMDGVAEGNIYLEQAEAELATQQRLRALAVESLEARIPLRAAVSGPLLVVPVQPGAVVGAGRPVFEIADRSRARISVPVFDGTLARRIRSATLNGHDGKPLPLALRGQDRAPGSPGWRLLLDTVPNLAAELMPGELLPVSIQVSAVPVPACAAPHRREWVQTGRDRFEPRSPPGCGNPPQPGEQMVVEGAALLDEYL